MTNEGLNSGRYGPILHFGVVGLLGLGAAWILWLTGALSPNDSTEDESPATSDSSMAALDDAQWQELIQREAAAVLDETRAVAISFSDATASIEFELEEAEHLLAAAEENAEAATEAALANDALIDELNEAVRQGEDRGQELADALADKERLDERMRAMIEELVRLRVLVQQLEEQKQAATGRQAVLDERAEDAEQCAVAFGAVSTTSTTTSTTTAPTNGPSCDAPLSGSFPSASVPPACTGGGGGPADAPPGVYIGDVAEVSGAVAACVVSVQLSAFETSDVDFDGFIVSSPSEDVIRLLLPPDQLRTLSELVDGAPLIRVGDDQLPIEYDVSEWVAENPEYTAPRIVAEAAPELVKSLPEDAVVDLSPAAVRALPAAEVLDVSVAVLEDAPPAVVRSLPPEYWEGLAQDEAAAIELADSPLLNDLDTFAIDTFNFEHFPAPTNPTGESTTVTVERSAIPSAGLSSGTGQVSVDSNGDIEVSGVSGDVASAVQDAISSSDAVSGVVGEIEFESAVPPGQFDFESAVLPGQTQFESLVPPGQFDFGSLVPFDQFEFLQEGAGQ